MSRIPSWGVAGTGHMQSRKERSGREQDTNGQQRVTTNGQSQVMLSVRMAVIKSLLSSIFHEQYGAKHVFSDFVTLL